MKSIFKRKNPGQTIVYPGIKNIRNKSFSKQPQNNFKNVFESSFNLNGTKPISIKTKFSSWINNKLESIYEKSYELFSRDDSTYKGPGEKTTQYPIHSFTNENSARKLINSNTPIVNNGFESLIRAGGYYIHKIISWLNVALELDSLELNISETNLKIKAYCRSKINSNVICIQNFRHSERHLFNFKKYFKNKKLKVFRTQKISKNTSDKFNKKLENLTLVITQLFEKVKSISNRLHQFYKIE